MFESNEREQDKGWFRPGINKYILCIVCGGRSSGFHYGAFTCEGCKMFFRRTLKRDREILSCNNRNKCIITMTNRNRCKLCRFQKCIASGMHIDATNYRRCSKNKSCLRFVPMMHMSRLNYDEVIASAVHKAYEKAFEAFDNFTKSFRETRVVVKGKADLLQLAKRYFQSAIHFIVTFAKEIPLFNSLPKYDQRLIVEDGTIALIAINPSLHFEFCDNLLFNAKLNVTILKDKIHGIGNLVDIFTAFNCVTVKLKKHRFTFTELSLISAMALLCPENDGVVSKVFLENRVMEICVALKRQLVVSHNDQIILFAKAIEILTEIREFRYLTKSHLDGTDNHVSPQGRKLTQT